MNDVCQSKESDGGASEGRQSGKDEMTLRLGVNHLNRLEKSAFAALAHTNATAHFTTASAVARQAKSEAARRSIRLTALCYLYSRGENYSG